MQRKPFISFVSSLLGSVLFSSLAGAQAPATPSASEIPSAPPSVDAGMTPQSMDVGTTDQVGDADPLDVLEPKKPAPENEPTVPQFTEIPDPEAPAENAQKENAANAPAPEVMAEPFVPPTAQQLKKKKEKPQKVSKEAAPAKKEKKQKEKPAQAVGIVNNEPDIRRENRFHNIYKKYNEQPTSDEAWEKAAGSRKAELYKVQKGDTLWAVSQAFFADNNYWPKLWSLNVGSIANPHEIDPRMTIQFFPGTMSDAPTLGLVEKSEETSDTAASGDPVEKMDDVTLPKRRKHTPLLTQLPPSLPGSRQYTEATTPVTLDLPSLAVRVGSISEYMSYYVSDQALPSVGIVAETEMGMNTATEYQYVIVQLNAPLTDARGMMAARELTRIQDPDSPKSSTRLIEVQGEVEILESVNPSQNMYRAFVRKAIQPIDVGAKLVLSPLPTFDPSPTAAENSIHAKIVGGEFEGKRKQYHSNMIVFLNAGSSQGVRVGQSLPIYSNIRHRNLRTAAQTNDRQVGMVKVIRVAEGFATAYVTLAQDDIFVGDHVGARNPQTASNGLSLGNTDIEKAPPDDLLQPTAEPQDERSDADASEVEL